MIQACSASQILGTVIFDGLGVAGDAGMRRFGGDACIAVSTPREISERAVVVLGRRAPIG
jgi:hypothetical protein